MWLVALLLCSCAALWPHAAMALSAERAQAIASGDSDARIAALNQTLAEGDAQLASFIQAMLDDGIKLSAGRVLQIDGEKVLVVGTGEAIEWPEDAEDVVVNNRMRQALEGALAGMRLSDADPAVRAQAITQVAAVVDETWLPILDRALAAEADAGLKARLGNLRARASIGSPDVARRLAAVGQLADSADPDVRSLLLERLAVEDNAQMQAALKAAAAGVEQRLAWGERLGLFFAGASLGSILLLAALGLAITYGLMGVINMAHGELIMIGAYATYVVQNLFRQWWPAGFDAYVLVAIPVSFLTAAAVGAVLERSVIRWLYGRPLETLLATWGISLILMQAVRSLFGAQNVAVENPSWMSGGWQVLPNLTLPYNRLAILVFAGLVLAGVALLISRTRLGLFVRGVTQNRAMAACMGVNTARVDTYAFSLGAGIAGLAGCALSQVGNVGPDLGQGYIVDSFMVVVLGGVGQLAGTVYAGLGLGVINKLLEGWQGAVLAKIMVLVLIVMFIQKRPQGIFALKGREQ
jgi:urea transport system permease protein